MRPALWIPGSIALAFTLILALLVLYTHPARTLPEGHFYTGVTERPADLNPFTTSEQVSRRSVLRFTHDALMDWDPKTGLLREALAETVDRRPDNVTFDFTLREDVRFADGSPVTMEDVLFTWDVYSGSKVPMGTMGDGLARVRDVQILRGQPDRLRVVLDEPYFAGLAGFAPAWTVVNKAYFLAEVERLAREAGRPVPVGPKDEGFGELLAMVKLPGPGSGPYQLEPDVRSGRLPWQTLPDLYLVQNPGSWRRRVCNSCWQLDGFRLRFLTDPAAVFVELLAGELDWYGHPDPEGLFEEYPRLRPRFDIHEYDYQNLGHHWIIWNHRRKPLDDPRVRRALSMLFDRKTILEEYLGGHGELAVSFFKPGTPYYPESPAVVFDPDGARELLQEVVLEGKGEPLKIHIVAPRSPDGFYRRVLQLAESAFNQVAEIDLDWQTLEWSALLDMRSRRDFDGLFYFQGHKAWVDPFPEFHSSQAGENGQNHMGYENLRVDEILEAARRQMDEGERIKLFREFNAIVEKEQPVTFLVHPRFSGLVNSAIQGVEPGPLGLFPERWSMK